MKNSLFMILLVLSLLSGCANSGFQYAIVSKDEPVYSSLPSGQRHSFAPTWQIDSESEQFGTFHVKYHPSYNAKHCIVVEGSIGGSKNGFDPSTSLRAGELTTRKYPIVLDTGA